MFCNQSDKDMVFNYCIYCIGYHGIVLTVASVGLVSEQKPLGQNPLGQNPLARTKAHEDISPQG